MQSIKTWVGVDVSAKTLAACRWREGGEEERDFRNDGAGHRELIKWIGKRGRVCVEATGVYHLQLALALREAGVELMVINPRVAKDFARALSNRSKTDAVDARALLEYVRRMDFQQWQAPSAVVMEVRELSRRVTELVQASVDEKNRLHAKETAAISRAVMTDVERHLVQLEERIARIDQAAFELIGKDEDLRAQYKILTGVRGVGRRSAILLLGELAVLDATMTTRQIVAYAGLDPRVFESGTSVQKTVRISKVGNARVRAIIYMIALSAVRHDRAARLFFARLVARGKKRMQALVAVMRKLLHGMWIALQRRIAFDSSILFAASLAQAESIDSTVAASQPQLAESRPKRRSEPEDLREQVDPPPARATHRRKRPKAA